MSNNEEKNKNNLCTHSISLKTNSNQYIYCPKCGSISINYENNSYYTLKPKNMENEIEIDPVQVVKEMIKNQKINFPFLENDFNINPNESQSKINQIKENIFLYLSKRKTLLLYLQNITRILNYSDLSFYHCLLDIDLYLSHNISQKMTNEDLIYYLIGFFLNSSKFKETDIYEPELYIFCNNDSKYNLNKERISYYEAKCLKLMGYNFFIFSAYDWLSTFMGIGYIFEGEIDKNNLEEINEINTYAFKLLVAITPKNIFFKYSTLYSAISIIKICREDKLDKNKINNTLFDKLLDIYNITFKDCENCYNEIRFALDNDNSERISTYSGASNIDSIKKNRTLGEMQLDKKDFENLKKINNKFGNRIIKFNLRRKLNLKQNFKDSFQLKLFNSNYRFKTYSNNNQESINSGRKNRNNKNTIKRQKTLQIVEYMFNNLPKIGEENSNKRIKTDTGIKQRQMKKYFTIKNDAQKNNNIKTKKVRNRSGNSLDIKLVYKNDKSPLKFNGFIRNITFDALKNKEINNKKIKKNKSNNSGYLNKSNDTMKYVNTNPNININIKNNINIFFELKDKEKNKKNKKNNLEINIFKNNNYIMNNNNFNNRIKSKEKQNERNYSENKNNVKIIKKDIINNKKIAQYLKEEKTISLDKNIKNDLINRNNIINTKGKNFVFTKYNKNLVKAKDLFSTRKEIFTNQRFPKLKLKLNKND
jgi:hypothetical protein